MRSTLVALLSVLSLVAGPTVALAGPPLPAEDSGPNWHVENRKVDETLSTRDRVVTGVLGGIFVGTGALVVSTTLGAIGVATGAAIVLPAAMAVMGAGIVVWGGWVLYTAIRGHQTVTQPTIVVDLGTIDLRPMGSNTARGENTRGATPLPPESFAATANAGMHH